MLRIFSATTGNRRASGDAGSSATSRPEPAAEQERRAAASRPGRPVAVEPVAAGDQEEAFLEPPEVVQGVGEAVGVVDAQADHAPLADPAEDQAVDVLEDQLVLDPDAGQLGDVEEPPVVDLLGRDPPVREAVHLVFEQVVEAVEAPGVAGRPLERRDVLVDEGAEAGVPVAEAVEALLGHFLLAADLLDLLGLAEPARRAGGWRRRGC